MPQEQENERRRNFTSINVLSMFLPMNIYYYYSKITRINTCTSSTLFSDRNSDLLSLSGTQVFFSVPCSWHVDHIISHFFTELKIYHQSLIFKFNIFCTTDFLLLKMLLKIVPNSLKHEEEKKKHATVKLMITSLMLLSGLFWRCYLILGR